MIACEWDEQRGEYKVASGTTARTIRDLAGNSVPLGRGDSALVEPPPNPRDVRRQKDAGGNWWDVDWVGPGPRGEVGEGVLNGSPFLVRLASDQTPIAVIQVQLSLLDLPAVQDAIGSSDGRALLDLLDEISPDEIRRALPSLHGPARDCSLILSQDAVGRIIARARGH